VTTPAWIIARSGARVLVPSAETSSMVPSIGSIIGRASCAEAERWPE
jgi:hypothetical protein